MWEESTNEEHYEAFQDSDRYGNGSISEAELEEAAKSMVRGSDVDGDGQICFDEYVSSTLEA